jgi:hypothetical protein
MQGIIASQRLSALGDQLQLQIEIPPEKKGLYMK